MEMSEVPMPCRPLGSMVADVTSGAWPPLPRFPPSLPSSLLPFLPGLVGWTSWFVCCLSAEEGRLQSITLPSLLYKYKHNSVNTDSDWPGADISLVSVDQSERIWSPCL